MDNDNETLKGMEVISILKWEMKSFSDLASPINELSYITETEQNKLNEICQRSYEALQSSLSIDPDKSMMGKYLSVLNYQKRLYKDLVILEHTIKTRQREVQ